MMLHDRMPRTAGVSGGTQPGSDNPDPPSPPPSVPTGPLPPVPRSPSMPYPDEEQAPYDPGSRSEPQNEPQTEEMPAAASGGDKLSAVTEKLCADIDRLLCRNHRMERSLVAVMVGASSTLNFLHNAISRLDPEDWRNFRDLAEGLHRQTSELTELLAPLCPKEQAAKPRLSVVN